MIDGAFLLHIEVLYQCASWCPSDVHLSWKWQDCRHNTEYAHMGSKQNSDSTFSRQSCSERKKDILFFLINHAQIKENVFRPSHAA
jgi:hypothetical protein